MTDNTRQYSVIIVGAGPAGLATSRELQRIGADHVVLERAEIGASWRRYYDGLVLHTGRHLSSLPGLPFDRSDPMFVPRNRFVQYLESYAERQRLPVRTGVEVISGRREAGLWKLDTTVGPWWAGAVVVATGIASSPVVPVLPGMPTFSGRVSHSIDYRRPEAFAGRSVLVVGSGNSAGEIAAEVGRVTRPVCIAIRSGVVVVPRAILGIPSQYIGVLVRRLPRALFVPLINAATRLRERRLPRSLPRSSSSPLDTVPLVGMNLPDAIEHGGVSVRTGVVGFEGSLVRFSDGTAEPFDEVIMATGFRAAIEWLDGLVGRDERGFGRRTNRVRSADQPWLFFVGHEYDASGGLVNIRRDAPMAARLAAEWRAETPAGLEKG
jgi:cation diffusion facilitator CzcD-associated flavoprotein CzcO